MTRVILGEARGCPGRILRAALAPVGMLYAAGVRLRNALFDCGLRRVRELPAPVVSVGNLSLGGTGKTPMVEWVVRRLRDGGRKPAILSRGYGARVGAENGGVNEEAAVLAENVAEIPHLRNPDRFAAGMEAIEKHGADVLVLDDGFQHRKLRRDLNIVLIDALAPPDRDRVFPWGSLREPVGDLRRADFVVLTHADLAGREQVVSLRALIERIHPGMPVAEASHRATGVWPVTPGSPVSEDISGARVYAFCGIGRPEAFRLTLEAMGAVMAGICYFPDHHRYDERDLAQLQREAAGTGAEVVLTTQKDAVKVRSRWQGMPLGEVRIALAITAGEADLDAALEGVRA